MIVNATLAAEIISLVMELCARIRAKLRKE